MKSDISTTKIDILNRIPFVDQLFDIVEKLSDKQKSCTFAVNGEWGCGKSFVMDMFEEKIKTQQNEETANDKYLLFHYDCWEYDYYEEPLFAIVSAILDKIESETKNHTFENAKKYFSVAGRSLIKLKGFGLIENIKKAEKEYEEDHNITDFDAYFNFKDTLKEVQKAFQKLAEDKTLVVVVDELDRCLPTYTVKVLERLHHIFGKINNCIVILAVDKEQLEHTVKSIYGTTCDTDAYLRKFIDFEVKLDTGTVDEHLLEKHSDYFNLFNINDSVQVIQTVNHIFDELDQRSREKILSKAKILHEIVFESSERPDCGAMCAELLFLVVKLKNSNYNNHRVLFEYEKTFDGLTVSEKIKSLFEQSNQLKIYKCMDEINSYVKKKSYDVSLDSFSILTYLVYYYINMHIRINTNFFPSYSFKEQTQYNIEKNVKSLKQFAEMTNFIQ